MDGSARAPYDARAAAEKQRYEQQMAMYVPTPGFSSKGSRKRVSPSACYTTVHKCGRILDQSLGLWTYRVDLSLELCAQYFSLGQ